MYFICILIRKALLEKYKNWELLIVTLEIYINFRNNLLAKMRFCEYKRFQEKRKRQKYQDGEVHICMKRYTYRLSFRLNEKQEKIKLLGLIF